MLAANETDLQPDIEIVITYQIGLWNDRFAEPTCLFFF